MNLSYIQSPLQIVDITIANNKIIGETIKDLAFRFSINPVKNSTVTTFTIEIIQSVIDSKQVLIFGFTTTTSFQLAEFQSNADLFLLKMLVADAYNAHQDAVNELKIKTIQVIDLRLLNLLNDNVEDLLKVELSNFVKKVETLQKLTE